MLPKGGPEGAVRLDRPCYSPRVNTGVLDHKTELAAARDDGRVNTGGIGSRQIVVRTRHQR